MIGPDGKGAWTRDDRRKAEFEEWKEGWGHQIDEEQIAYYKKHPYLTEAQAWFFLIVCLLLLIGFSSFIGLLIWTKIGI